MSIRAYLSLSGTNYEIQSSRLYLCWNPEKNLFNWPEINLLLQSKLILLNVALAGLPFGQSIAKGHFEITWFELKKPVGVKNQLIKKENWFFLKNCRFFFAPIVRIKKSITFAASKFWNANQIDERFKKREKVLKNFG